MEYSLPFICLCLAVWLCLKMGDENLVPVMLLQIGATDLTVICAKLNNKSLAQQDSGTVSYTTTNISAFCTTVFAEWAHWANS